MHLLGRQQFCGGRNIANAKRTTALFQAEKLRLLLHYLRAHPCVDCGEADPIVLDFDQRDPTLKRMALSGLIWRSTWASIEVEIARCDVRCWSCHRRESAAQLERREAALVAATQQGRQGSNPRRSTPKSSPQCAP